MHISPVRAVQVDTAKGNEKDEIQKGKVIEQDSVSQSGWGV